jgi:hypothetical protein
VAFSVVDNASTVKEGFFMTKLIAAMIITVALAGMYSGTAFAGEVTGKGKPTPVREHNAASICSFSGLEDWNSTAPQVPHDAISVTPGVTQTPHAVFDEGEWQYPPPGTPGFACSPGRPAP